MDLYIFRFLNMDKNTVIIELQLLRNEKSLEGMSRFGINIENAFGISMVQLRILAKRIGKNHTLAFELWQTRYHEARILASMIDIADDVTSLQMNEWVKDFNSWDLCDQCCGNLFRYTSFAYEKAVEWSFSDVEYIRRAGFVMMASLAIGDKKAKDDKFLPFFELIIKHSDDDRNFVKKAVNWALRQMGKRSLYMRGKALDCIEILLKDKNKTAQWIAKDAQRELNNVKTIKNIKR